MKNQSHSNCSTRGKFGALPKDSRKTSPLAGQGSGWQEIALSVQAMDLWAEDHASWMADGPHLTGTGLRLVEAVIPTLHLGLRAPECSSGGPGALCAHIAVSGGGKPFRGCVQGPPRRSGLMATATRWATGCSSLKPLCPRPPALMAKGAAERSRVSPASDRAPSFASTRGDR